MTKTNASTGPCGVVTFHELRPVGAREHLAPPHILGFRIDQRGRDAKGDTVAAATFIEGCHQPRTRVGRPPAFEAHAKAAVPAVQGGVAVFLDRDGRIPDQRAIGKDPQIAVHPARQHLLTILFPFGVIHAPAVGPPFGQGLLVQLIETLVAKAHLGGVRRGDPVAQGRGMAEDVRRKRHGVMVSEFSAKGQRVFAIHLSGRRQVPELNAVRVPASIVPPGFIWIA